jgi:hypothetical protein
MSTSIFTYSVITISFPSWAPPPVSDTQPRAKKNNLLLEQGCCPGLRMIKDTGIIKTTPDHFNPLELLFASYKIAYLFWKSFMKLSFSALSLVYFLSSARPTIEAGKSTSRCTNALEYVAGGCFEGHRRLTVSVFRIKISAVGFL